MWPNSSSANTPEGTSSKGRWKMDGVVEVEEDAEEGWGLSWRGKRGWRWRGKEGWRKKRVGWGRMYKVVKLKSKK